MAEPADMIIPMLPEMRAENAGLHEQTRAMIAELKKRLGGVEGAQKNIRAALTADTLLSRILTGEFEERIEALERKVEVLEGRK
jgi:hypothetical protein